MIALILSTVLAMAQPAAEQASPSTMPPELARARVAQAIGEDVDPAIRQETLSEVIERAEDPQIVALAQYNLGTTLIAQAKDEPDRLDDAIESFRAADRGSTSSAIQSKARFNLGHAYYIRAHAQNTDETAQAQPGDMQGMIDSLKKQVEELKRAGGAFRSVIDVDAANAQASANVERIRKEIKGLEDQIKSLEEMQRQQKEQQQQKQKQQQDAADKLKDLAKEQQKQGEKSENSPPEDKQQGEQQKKDQQELSKKTDDAQSDIAKKKDMDKISEKLKEAQQAQKQAQEAMEKGDSQQAAKEQKKAAKALQEAAKAMQDMADASKKKGEDGKKGEQSSDEKDQGKQGENGEQDGQPKSDADKDLGDEISEIAKQLLDKERREREARKIYSATGRPTKVDKDW